MTSGILPHGLIRAERDSEPSADLPARPDTGQNRSLGRRLLPAGLAGLLLALWHFGTAHDESTQFLLASPRAVIDEFGTLLANGVLLRHLGISLVEIVLGFCGGVGFAFVLGYGIARSRFLEQMLGPYVVGFQAVPMIAIAPLLIRFLGPGVPTIAMIAGLIVFFPMLVSTVVAIRGIDPNQRALMRSLAATRWQTFLKLEFPGALPTLFGGLKISTTLAVVGAVVGEAFGAQGGLGFLIYASRFVYNAAGVLVAVITLTALALFLYEIVARLERRWLAWRMT